MRMTLAQELILFIVLLLVSFVSLVSPITVMRILMRWPKFIFPRLFSEEQIRPLTREAMRLIDEDPREYGRRFWYQLLMLRITGVIALLMSLILLLIIAVSLSS